MIYNISTFYFPTELCFEIESEFLSCEMWTSFIINVHINIYINLEKRQAPRINYPTPNT
jgi:hypothetical protein